MTRLMMMALVTALTSTPAGSEEPAPALGKPAPAELVQRWNLSVFPDGRGLPAGSGDAASGKKIYERHCISCHAAAGAGGSGDRLARAEMGLTDEYPQKTIANYWPYATTLFDFIRRSKPMDDPGSFSNDEVYALTAYLLSLDDIIDDDRVIDRDTLPGISMPNADGFIDAWQSEPINDSQ